VGITNTLDVYPMQVYRYAGRTGSTYLRFLREHQRNLANAIPVISRYPAGLRIWAVISRWFCRDGTYAVTLELRHHVGTDFQVNPFNFGKLRPSIGGLF
jgi:hypothetical protein